MKSQIIETTDEGIVLNERPYELTGAELQLILNATYEKAKDDATAFNFLNVYDNLFSIATTLFITLFTTDVRGIGSFDAEQVKGIIIFIIILFYSWAMVALLIKFITKLMSPTKIRDKSIKEIIDKYNQKK